MKSISKKWLLTSLTLSGALLLAACGNDGGSDVEDEAAGDGGESTEEVSLGSKGAMEDFKVGDTFVATEPLNLEILYRDMPAYPLDKEWMFFDVLEEEHNVTFDIVSIPLSDWEERLSITMAAGDMPDYSTDIWAGHEIPYVPSGQLLPISDYVEYMPHLSSRIEEWEGVEEQMNNLRQQDGKYYVLPGLNENIVFEFGLQYNTTVFEEHGIAEPNSWDELRAALETLKEETGSKAPMTLWWQGNALLNFASASFGSGAGGWGYMNGVVYDEEADEFVFTAMQDGFKDMITYFSELTADGLLDIEAMTQDDQMARNKLLNLESFVTSGNVGTLTDLNDGLAEQHGEGAYEFSRLPVLEGPAGKRARGGNTNSGMMLNADLAEREDFLAILQFIDWLYYSDEGTEFAHWGVEGVTFEKTDEFVGGYKPVDGIQYEQFNPGAEKSLQEHYGFGNVAFAYAGPAHIRQSIMEEKEFNYQKRMNEEVEVVLPDPPHPMDSLTQENANMIGTPLKDTVDQYVFRFISNQYSMDRWDEFMSALENQNVDGYVEMINEAYRENQEKLQGAE